MVLQTFSVLGDSGVWPNPLENVVVSLLLFQKADDMVRFRRYVLFHLLQQYLQCQCTFKICNYLCLSYSGVHLELKYLLGGLYHSSIIKSFAWCYSVLILVVSPGPCIGSYIEQGNLLLYLTLLIFPTVSSTQGPHPPAFLDGKIISFRILALVPPHNFT